MRPLLYDARLPQSKDALLSVLAESSSPEREFSCVTFNNPGIQSGYGGACAGTERTGERCVYTKGWDQKCRGILRHPVSQHSDGSSDHYEKPLRLAPETSVVLCTDRNHVKYIRRYFKISIRWIFFRMREWSWEAGTSRCGEGLTVLYAVSAWDLYGGKNDTGSASSIPEVDGQLMAGDVLAELVHHPDRTTGRKSLKSILRTGEAISRTSACRRSLCRCVLSTPTPLRFGGAGGAYSGGKRNPGHGVRQDGIR